MDDAARIRALRDQGRIDDEQADRLLAALGALDEGGGGSVAASSASSSPEAARATTPQPGEPVASPRSAPAPSAPPTVEPPVSASASTPGSAGEGVVRRWARVEMLAGTLEVRVDATLDAPVAETDEGEIEVESDGAGWRVRQRSSREGSNWIERLVDGLKRSEVRLRLPGDTGLDVDIKAGDVDLRDVPALRGRLLAGDLEAVGLRAIDVAVEAGDLDVALDPAPGAHRIRMTVGDAEVRLPSGADVAVRGRVSVGDVTAPAGLRTNRSTVSERVEGTLGEGRASLSIELVTGDLDIVVG